MIYGFWKPLTHTSVQVLRCTLGLAHIFLASFALAANRSNGIRFPQRKQCCKPPMLQLCNNLPNYFSRRFTLLLGVIGNLLILISILGYKKMKSSTNVFLASLALADLLLCLICIPVKVRHQYTKMHQISEWQQN